MSMDNSDDVKLNETEKKELETIVFGMTRVKMAADELASKTLMLNEIRRNNELLHKELDSLKFDQQAFRDLQIMRKNVVDELQKVKEQARERAKDKMIIALRYDYLKKVNALLLDHAANQELMMKDFNDLCNELDREMEPYNQDKQKT